MPKLLAEIAAGAAGDETEHGVGRDRSRSSSKKPLTASLIVPSPPTAMIS